jgi:hypothetical protein
MTVPDWPHDEQGGVARVIELARRAEQWGQVATFRFVAYEHPTSKLWLPVFGRIDFAASGDLPPTTPMNFGKVRVVTEEVACSQAIGRLRSALGGGPLACGGLRIDGHGMDGQWRSWWATRDRASFGAAWPAIVAFTDDHPRSPHANSLLDDDAGHVYGDLSHLVQDVSGCLVKRASEDARLRRTQVLFWDRRARLARATVVDNEIRVTVDPPNDDTVKLVLTFDPAGSAAAQSFDAPADVVVAWPKEAIVARARVRCGSDTVDDLSFAPEEAGCTLPPPGSASSKALTAPTPTAPSASITVAREGIFFAGQPFDAMRAISGILKTAAKSIVLVDAYIGETTLDILSARPNGVLVDILTHDKPKQTTTSAFKALAVAWNKQHGGGLGIRTSTAFHDRFIIIDDADVYHLGTSIKDAAVKGGFMFSRIEEPSVVTALRDKLANEWPTATVFV